MADYFVKAVEIDILAGDRLDNAIKNAIALAKSLDPMTIVSFDFNGTPIEVGGASDPDVVYSAVQELWAARQRVHGARVKGHNVEWGKDGR